MKVRAPLGIAILFLSFGTVVAAFSQNEDKNAKPEQKQQPQRHAQPQDQSKQRPQESVKKQDKQEQQARHHQNQQQPQDHAQKQNQHPDQNQDKERQQQAKQQPGQRAGQHTPEQQRVQHAAWQGHRSQNWQSDHRTWQQRGGYHGYHIPENRYDGSFGPDHGFVIFSQPYMVVGGSPRFQYGGYWFSLVDPWPESWSSNWYETDDVYVAYVDNGYYMYNRRYPTIAIAISASM